MYGCMCITYISLIFQLFRFVSSLQFALSIGTHKSQTIFQFQISQLQLQIFFAGLPSVRVCVCALSETDLLPINMLRARQATRPPPFASLRAAVDQVGGNSRKRRQAAKKRTTILWCVVGRRPPCNNSNNN